MSVVAHKAGIAAAAAQAAKELDDLRHDLDPNDFAVSKSRARGLGLSETNPEQSKSSLDIEDTEMEDVEPGNGYDRS